MSTIDDSNAGSRHKAFYEGAESFTASHPEEDYHIVGSLSQAGLTITISGGLLAHSRQITVGPMLHDDFKESVLIALEQACAQSN
ncbi:MAG: hypothetical protein ABSH47_16910 [Bryobacteraceae bacterium]|jgi:hypothetical protein